MLFALCVTLSLVKINDMKAVKKEIRDGVFRFELENGEVIVKSTKRNYTAFALTYAKNFHGVESLFACAKSTKGETEASDLAQRNGNTLGRFFTVTV